MGLLDVDVTECDFYYFGVRTPVGLPVIAALEMGGVQYNANPMDFESWSKMKPNTPTGLLPLMKLRDGSYVIESQAILRAVGCATGAIGTGTATGGAAAAAFGLGAAFFFAGFFFLAP